MKALLIPAAVAALGMTATAPASAGMPAPALKQALTNIAKAKPGNLGQVRYHPYSRRCRILLRRARAGSRRAAYLFRRYCRGGRVSFRQCRRWYVLGFRRGIPRYRHLYRRYCRGYGHGHVSHRQCRRWYVLGYRHGIARYRYQYRRFCRYYR